MLFKQTLNNASNARARLALTGLLAVSQCLLASGCGSAPAHTPSVQVDPELSSYVARFEQAAADNGHAMQVTDLSMSFGQVDAAGESGGRGVCVAVTGQTPSVTISPDAWAASTDAEREELVFHELGHCLLSRTHVAGINAQGIPESIMDPSEITGAIYSQNRDYYLATLFQ